MVFGFECRIKKRIVIKSCVTSKLHIYISDWSLLWFSSTIVVAPTSRWFVENSWILTDSTRKEAQPCTNTLFWAIVLSVWDAVLQISQNILPPDVVFWDVDFGAGIKTSDGLCFSLWAAAPVWVSLWVSLSLEFVTRLQQNATSWSLSRFLRWKLSLWSSHGVYYASKLRWRLSLPSHCRQNVVYVILRFLKRYG